MYKTANMAGHELVQADTREAYEFPQKFMVSDNRYMYWQISLYD